MLVMDIDDYKYILELIIQLQKRIEYLEKLQKINK